MANVEQPPSNMAPPTDTAIGESRSSSSSSSIQSSPSRHSAQHHHHHHHHHSSATTSTTTTTQQQQSQQQQPLHTSSSTQTPGYIMPPSARHITTQSQPFHTAQRRNNHNNHNSSSASSSTSSTPDSFKCTPMTLQMTPDYDTATTTNTTMMDDPIGHHHHGTVTKQLCHRRSSDGTLEDASSSTTTEAADSSKSSEFEISDDVVLLQFITGCGHSRTCDLSPLKTPPPVAAVTATAAAVTTSRTLFSLDDDDDDDDDDHLNNDDDDEDDDDNEHSTHNYSDILIEESATTCTYYGTPNHSSSTTGSPHSFERAYSEGNVSPIHPPKQQQLHHTSRSLSFRYPPIVAAAGNHHPSESVCTYEPDLLLNGNRRHCIDNTTNNNNDIDDDTRMWKQLRSRRSLRNGVPPKSLDRIVNGKQRSRKKKGSKNHSKTTTSTDYPKSVDEHYNDRTAAADDDDVDGVDEYCSLDSPESTDDDDDVFIVEDRSERSRDSSSAARMKQPPSSSSQQQQQQQQYHHHPPARLSLSSATRRKSGNTTKHHGNGNNNNNNCNNYWWKTISQRLSTTQSLIWMLCFVGLTSVTMIVTMNHHMAQVARMEQQNHLSVLFNHHHHHQFPYHTAKTRGFAQLLRPPVPPHLKTPQLLVIDSKLGPTVSSVQIRGSSTNNNMAKSVPSSMEPKSDAAIPKVTRESATTSSTSTRRTVNLNTLAQLPHENALQKLVLTNPHPHHHHGSTANDHHHSAAAGGHHHHHHHADDNKLHDTTSGHIHHHHSQHHSSTTSDLFHDASDHDIDEEEEDGDEDTASNDHHPVVHIHSHGDSQHASTRLYVKANPTSRIGFDAIPKVAIPEIWDDDGVRQSFDRIDPFLYTDHLETFLTENSSTTTSASPPRIVFLDGEYFVPFRERPVRRHRSEVTDSTQLYSILDSGDERIASMELRAPFEQGECVPMQEWQTTFNPSCNGMHELDLPSMGDNRLEDDFKLFGMNGFWRNAWRYDSTGGHSSLSERDTVVLKTLRINHRFEDAYFENNRIDAVVLERLTASPHVINVFGFCGHSVLTEFADGKRLGELADKMSKVPLARLQIARDIANGLADVHGIDGDGNATFVHLDINPANVVSIGGTLKLNDFNIGVLRRWNTTSNSPCGIPAKYPNPQWRSPEEARLEQNLTEKVDVFSLGHILFRLICGHEPWHKLEPGGMPSKEALNDKVRQGILPTIPLEIMSSTDAEIVAVREAMLRCYTYDPMDRPSARDIAIALQTSLNALEMDTTRTDTILME